MSGAQYPTDPVMIDTKSVIMYKDKIGMTIPIGVHELEVDAVRDHVFNTLLVRLRAYVLSEHLVADTYTDSKDVPDTWWDHFKSDARLWCVTDHGRAVRILKRPFTWWLWRRKPIKHRTLTLSCTWERRATRPESTIRMPDKLGPVVYQETLNHSLKWEDDHQ